MVPGGFVGGGSVTGGGVTTGSLWVVTGASFSFGFLFFSSFICNEVKISHKYSKISIITALYLYPLHPHVQCNHRQVSGVVPYSHLGKTP